MKTFSRSSQWFHQFSVSVLESERLSLWAESLDLFSCPCFCAHFGLFCLRLSPPRSKLIPGCSAWAQTSVSLILMPVLHVWTLRLYCSSPTNHVYPFSITLFTLQLYQWISVIGLYDTILASRRQCFLIVSVLGLNVGISYLAYLSISFAHFTSFWQVSFLHTVNTTSWL